MIPKLTNYKLH